MRSIYYTIHSNQQRIHIILGYKRTFNIVLRHIFFFYYIIPFFCLTIPNTCVRAYCSDGDGGRCTGKGNKMFFLTRLAMTEKVSITPAQTVMIKDPVQFRQKKPTNFNATCSGCKQQFHKTSFSTCERCRLRNKQNQRKRRKKLKKNWTSFISDIPNAQTNLQNNGFVILKNALNLPSDNKELFARIIHKARFIPIFESLAYENGIPRTSEGTGHHHQQQHTFTF